MRDLIYIEFISRNPSVGLDAFRFMAKTLQEAWESEHERDDVLLFNIGRTWRIGPEPEFLTIWQSPGGLRRLDEWEGLYKGGEEDQWNVPFRLAGRMDAAGCYEALLPPSRGASGRYYAEYFDHAEGVSREDVRAYFVERAAQFPGLELSLLLDRHGLLGPDPRGLAIWSCDSWLGIAELAEAGAAVRTPIVGVTAGLYADIGLEIR